MVLDHNKALDLANEGQWNKAHEWVQQYSDEYSCLIHGYLHRIEGDLGNARYWYNRANAPMPENTLDEEFKRLYALIRSD